MSPPMKPKSEPCMFCKKNVAFPCNNSMLASTCSQCAPTPTDADRLMAVADAIAAPAAPAVVTNTPRAGETAAQTAARSAPRNVAPKPTDTMVGGDHYTKMAIQPLTYIQANEIGFEVGNIVKYVSRYKSKNGIQDLEKARDMLDKLIVFEKEKAARGLMEYLSGLFKAV